MILVLIGFNFNKSYGQIAITPHIQLKCEASMKVLPDKAFFYIQISATSKSESECNERLNKLNDDLLSKLKSEGFTPDQIKLTNYSISAEYDYSNGESKKTGYKAYQDFQVNFKLDKKRILSVYNKLSGKKNENISINFGTECSDELKKKTKNELIVLAMKDASQKAQLIAESSGNKLGNYEWIHYNVLSNNVPMMYMESKASFAMMNDTDKSSERAENFSINEIEFREEIEVSYQINK